MKLKGGAHEQTYAGAWPDDAMARVMAETRRKLDHYDEMLSALENAREQLRQAWACIEHIKDHAPRDERESAVATMGDIGDIGLDCDAVIAKATGES